jgi:acetyl esterase
MPLAPEIVALIASRPASLPPREVDAPTLRESVAAKYRGAPRYPAPVASVQDRSIPTAAVDIPVRLYAPTTPGPWPLIVYYHGGGYVLGDLDISDGICRALAAGVGALVVSVDYRLAPEHPYPAPNDDAWAALQWAAANAAELGADPARIAVAGDSAGANLAASATLRARDAGLRLTAQLLLYPSPDYPDITLPSYRAYGDISMLKADDALWFWEQYLPAGAGGYGADAMPTRAASHAGLPAAFVSLAECDGSHDTGQAYADALIAAGVPTEVRRLEGMPHGFYAFLAAIPAVRRSMDEVCDWLRSKMAG